MCARIYVLFFDQSGVDNGLTAALTVMPLCAYRGGSMAALHASEERFRRR